MKEKSTEKKKTEKKEDQLTPEMRQKQYDSIEEILLNTQEQGQMMAECIQNQLKTKDELITRLHDELDHYRDDNTQRYIDAVMKNLTTVCKNMKKCLNKDPETSPIDWQKQYQYILDDLTDLLAEQDIEAFSSKEGDLFDGKTQKPSQIIPTDQPELNKMIVQSLEDGYRSGERILVYERVAIYQYQDSAK